MFVWHLTRFVAVVNFLQYLDMQWEIACNINLSVEGSRIKLSGPGTTIAFPNIYTILILPVQVSKISLPSQASEGARLKIQQGKKKVNSV